MNLSKTADQALSLFHPMIRRWFKQTYAAPTDIQIRSWPYIASGGHVLLTAPTGSGKTLCAFLWAINQLVTDAWSRGSTRVLYISPLKALNNDIRRNLVHPLREIRERFSKEGIACPEIRIMTRSGDTPSRERQQMLRRPPEILITTPESLNLLVSSPRARENLGSLETVILDEIHAIAADKRGTHLITAVERLVLLSGEFQRVALSATVRPLEGVAEWIGGYILDRGPEAALGRSEPVYRRRVVTILKSNHTKKLDLRVHTPGGTDRGALHPKSEVAESSSQDVSSPGMLSPTTSAREAFWYDLVQEIKSRIRKNRSTLIFTNTRRHAEKLARMINEDEDIQLAYAHHGSLSKEIRLVVEQRLKAGELSAIVATSSLELGIDIGELDEVLLVQTPFSVSSTLQRLGRAGHGVGQVSRGWLYPTHGRDLLNAGLMARCLAEQDIEEIHPVEGPLDLLAQIILSMTGIRAWNVDELYETVRTSSPYYDLPRKHFDLVIEMLAGRYADQYLRELKPRLSWDKLENTVRACRGARFLVYRSGGTIPDRGYYDLRIQQNAAKIGELDEEFVWERKIGDTFNLGTQSWKIVRIDSKNVEVIPWNGPITITPFWRAEKAGRDFHYSEKVGRFLELWNDRLGHPEMVASLVNEYFLDEPSAEALIAFLKRQKAATAGELPHRHHLLIEHVKGPLTQAALQRVILHTLWGARVNFPLSLILEAAWGKAHRKSRVEVLADDDCLLIIPSDPERFSVDELLSLVRPEAVEALLRNSLEGSGFFGARFRENAGRALIIPRSNLDRRIPLWLTRMRSKKLLEGVAGYPEFPILLETWRSCLQDEFDLASLKIVLSELARGQIRRSEIHTDFPSPFADNISWIQTNQHMYESDALPGAGASAVQGDVIRQILYSSRLRPRIADETAAELQCKLQRTAPGYAPAAAEELLDWVKERLILPDPEWLELLDAVKSDHRLETENVEERIAGKLIRYRLPGAECWVVSALELMPRILRAFSQGTGRESTDAIQEVEVDEQHFNGGSLAWIRDNLEKSGFEAEGLLPLLSSLVGEWLRFYGPVQLAWISRCLGLKSPRLEAVLDASVESGSLVVDHLTRNATEPQVCDAENLEILLRLARKGGRSSFKALSLDHLPLFLASHQGLVAKARSQQRSTPEDLRRVLEQLFGFPAPVRLWEEELFPARLKPYFCSWLDALLQSSELQWFGCGRQRISFCFSSDLELFLGSDGSEGREDLSNLLPSPKGKFTFWDLVDHSGRSPTDMSQTIWKLVWRGRLSADSFGVLRKAAAGGFRSLPGSTDRNKARGRTGRKSYDRWRASHPSSASWYGIEAAVEVDPLEEEELARDRVRQLLQRYGILFREILSRELSSLQWPRLFRTLRIMELSGEILGGYFFEGIPGLQFVSHRALRSLETGLPQEEIFWVCALDPVSPCGLGLEMDGLPSRLASNHLVYHGDRLVLVSKGRGKEIEIRVPSEDPSIPRYLRVFGDLLSRDLAPRKGVRTETINGSAARGSPYKRIFLEFGFVEEYKGLVLRAGY